MPERFILLSLTGNPGALPFIFMISSHEFLIGRKQSHSDSKNVREKEKRKREAKGATSFSKKELQRTKLKRKGKERNGKKEEL